MTEISSLLRPLLRGEPLVQLHATDNDADENGELRFAFAEEPESSVASLFDIHPYTGLIVSKYNLQLRDLEFLGSPVSVLKQTHAMRIKVTSYFLDNASKVCQGTSCHLSKEIYKSSLNYKAKMPYFEVGFLSGMLVLPF